MLTSHSMTMEGMTAAVSGSGNVAQYATEKVLDLGGKVVTLSDSSGSIYDKDGIDREKLALEFVKNLESNANNYSSSFHNWTNF